MLQMLAEQVHWISPKHIYSSTAFQKAYPRRRQSCQPSTCATGRQQPGSTHELLRKDEKNPRDTSLHLGLGHLPVILLETREMCLPCSVVSPLQAKVEPLKMPAAILPISHTYLGHHHILPLFLLHPTPVLAQAQGPRMTPRFKNQQQITSTATTQTVVHLLPVRRLKTPIPLAHQPQGANNSRHNISFRFRTTKPQTERAI